MFFLTFNFFLIGTIIFLLIMLSWVWPPDSPWAPWWKTDKKMARIACKLAKINSKDVVYELGSGDGTFLIVAASEFGAKARGIEIDPLRFLISKIKTLFLKKERISFKRENFFNTNLSEASVVFVYLVPKTLEKLEEKFKKELKKETRVISFRYKMNLPLLVSDKENEISVYSIK